MEDPDSRWDDRHRRNATPQALTERVASVPLVSLKKPSERSASIHSDIKKPKLEFNAGEKDNQSREKRRWPPKVLDRPCSYFSQKREALQKHLPEGWRFGAVVAVISSTCALIANIVILSICHRILRRQGITSYIAPIRTGSCDDINGLSTRIHLAINILSTLILGGSNYCMQVVSAPARKDVDKAHRMGEWLHIGVPNLKNLRFIPRRKLCLWLILGGSSIPLHLIYNSVFFTSTVTNHYDIYLATEDFSTGSRFDSSLFPNPNRSTAVSETYWHRYVSDPADIQRSLASGNDSTFEVLDVGDCVKAYAKNILPERRNLILVTADPSNDSVDPSDWHTAKTTCASTSETSVTTEHLGPVSCGNSSLYAVMGYVMGLMPAISPGVSNWFFWICSQKYNYDSTTEDVPSLCSDGAWKDVTKDKPWTVYGFEVDHCLSERVDGQCSLNVGLSLLIVVIVFNVVKVVTIISTIFIVKDSPLATIGDAAASFIKIPDEATRGMCLYSRQDFEPDKKNRGGKAYLPVAAPRKFEPKQERWSSAASKRHWRVAMILTGTALAGILSFLVAIIMLNGQYDQLSKLLTIGLGALNPYTLIQGWALASDASATAVVQTVLVANLPQLLLSALYPVLNGLFTGMALAAEWSRHSSFGSSSPRRRGLRVSAPRPGSAQRSTYPLSLPYRLSLPLLAASAFLHWAVSQSIFVARIEGRAAVDGVAGNLNDLERGNYQTTVTTCGYSPLGILLALVAVAAIAGAAAAAGRWGRLGGGMPVAGSCSLAIAAACHAPEGTEAEGAVGWGVVREGGDGGDGGDGGGVGHCAFSNGEVGEPVPGRLYA